jgi:hypothetical protein
VEGEDLVRTIDEFFKPEDEEVAGFGLSPLVWVGPRTGRNRMIVIRGGRFELGDERKEGIIRLRQAGGIFGLGRHGLGCFENGI